MNIKRFRLPAKNKFLVEARRLELLTSGMQILRSAKLSYAPEMIGCGDRI